MAMKKTKIVATISGKTSNVAFLKALYEAGVNVVRLNTAHLTLQEALKVIEEVRSVSEKIAILIDTKGPEVRTVGVKLPIRFAKGEFIYMTGNAGEVRGQTVQVSYPHIVRDVPVGSRVLIDDGEVELCVHSKKANCLELEAMHDGIILDKKSVNVPGVNLNLPSLSEKDNMFIHFAIEQHLDFIAHSFVRNKKDVFAIQRILDYYHSPIKIIAKIENQEGVEHLDEILEHVYGVMVARGDLAIEIDAEKVPRIQRMIVRACIERKKPVIIATQMLHTMIEHPHPTRAEVGDIACAVYSGTDAVMLSGETANGAYPLEAVKVMAKVVEANESILPIHWEKESERISNETTAALAQAVIKISTMLPIKAIVIDTRSGKTARYLSAFRGAVPIFARCYEQNVMRELALSYGVEPYFASQTGFMCDIARFLLHEGYRSEDLILVAGRNFEHVLESSFLVICKVGEIEQREE